MPTYIKTKKPKRKQSETESRTMNKNNIKKLGTQIKEYKDIAETHTQNLGKLFNSCSNRGTYLDDCMEISHTKPIHKNTLRHLKIYSQEILKITDIDAK
jgi:hypothetical protein